MMEGITTGLYNSRGVVCRGEGGNQERTIAKTYLAWAESLRYSHPYLASQVLDAMALNYENEGKRHDAEAIVTLRMPD